jgi:hypothetical protein
LKTTSKTLLAVVLGKLIVSDDWIRACARAKRTLNPSDYVLEDAEFETQHGRSIRDVYNNPLDTLFKDKAIHITPELKREYKNGFQDVAQILRTAGAKQVTSRTGRDVAAIVKAGNDARNLIVLGSDMNDPYVGKLQEDGLVVFRRELFAQSIFAGEALLKDERWMLDRGSPEVWRRRHQGAMK